MFAGEAPESVSSIVGAITCLFQWYQITVNQRQGKQPVTMAANLQHKVVNLFDGSNYTAWKHKMKMLLELRTSHYLESLLAP